MGYEPVQRQPYANTIYYASSSALTGVAMTATLTAMGAGQFHNIVKLELLSFATAAAAPAALPISLGSTNLRGTAFLFPLLSASAAGVNQRVSWDFNPPLAAVSGNTNTTFTLAATNYQQYLNCWYF
jgi:hypothetical protein